MAHSTKSPGLGFGLLAALAIGMGTLGCNKAADTPVTSSPAGAQDAHADHDHDHADHDHADHDPADHDHAGDAEIKEALAGLSADDRAAVEKQKVCPVSDEALGSMGAPIKVTVQGRDVYICCDGCQDSLTKDPEKYLAKLPQ